MAYFLSFLNLSNKCPVKRIHAICKHINIKDQYHNRNLICSNHLDYMLFWLFWLDSMLFWLFRLFWQQDNWNKCQVGLAMWTKSKKKLIIKKVAMIIRRDFIHSADNVATPQVALWMAILIASLSFSCIVLIST